MPGFAQLFKQGCFDADNVNALNTALTATPNLVGNLSLAAQAFGVFNTGAAVTLLPAGHTAGTYRVSFYIIITTTFVTNTAVTGAWGYTDENGANTVTVTGAALTAGTQLISTQLIRSTGAAAITFTPAKTGSAATAGVASYSATVERVI